VSDHLALVSSGGHYFNIWLAALQTRPVLNYVADSNPTGAGVFGKANPGSKTFRPTCFSGNDYQRMAFSRSALASKADCDLLLDIQHVFL